MTDTNPNNTACGETATTPDGRALLTSAMHRARSLGTAGMEFAANLCRLGTSTIKGAEYLRRDSVMNEVVAWRDAFDNAPKVDAEAVRAALAQQATERTILWPMADEDGKVDQWYFNCDGHYIDVVRDEDGKFSIYFRDRKDEGEGWLDQAEQAQQAAPEAPNDVCKPCTSTGVVGNKSENLNIKTASQPDTTAIPEILVLNESGVELGIERRADGKWAFMPTTLDGQRPRIGETTTASASGELLPCAHCGGGAELQAHHGEAGSSYAVWCSKCHIGTAWVAFDGLARRDWNSRATAPSREASVPCDVPVAMVDAYMAFTARAAYLHHPEVPYHGTVNGDSEGQWKRRFAEAAIRAALAGQQSAEQAAHAGATGWTMADAFSIFQDLTGAMDAIARGNQDAEEIARLMLKKTDALHPKFLAAYKASSAGFAVNIDPSLPPDTIEMRGANRVRMNLRTGEITEAAAPASEKGAAS